MYSSIKEAFIIVIVINVVWTIYNDFIISGTFFLGVIAMYNILIQLCMSL